MQTRKLLPFFFLAFVLLVPSIVFATELFSDGQTGSTMETSSDFSAWSGTVGSPVVSTDYAKEGSNSGKFDANGEYAYYTFSEESTAYARCYMRYTTEPTSGKRHFILELGAAIGGGSFVQCELYSDSGITKWRLWCWTTGGWESVIVDNPLPSTDTWYCVEIRRSRNTANGGQLWIDGNLVATCTGTIDNTAGNYNFVAGTRLLQSANTLYIDSIVLADTYIGVISGVSPVNLETEATETLNVTDSLSVSKTVCFTGQTTIETTTQNSYTKTLCFTGSNTLTVTEISYSTKNVTTAVTETTQYDTINPTATRTCTLNVTYDTAELALALAMLAFILAIVAIALLYANQKNNS